MRARGAGQYEGDLMDTSAAALNMLRTLMIAGGTYAATIGITGAQWEQITGAVVTLAGALWSLYRARQNHVAIVEAAVTGVAVQPGIAAPVTHVSSPEAVAAVKPPA